MKPVSHIHPIQFFRLVACRPAGVFAAACLTLCLLLPISCNKIDLPPFDQQIVVEGWIENGQHPVIILTGSVPVSQEHQDYEDLYKYIIKYAKVSITDSDTTYVLYSLVNKDYFPPLIYTTQRFVGKLGETYHLKVEYSGRTVTSTTTIPEKAPLLRPEDISSSVEEGVKHKITVKFDDDPLKEDYYQFFIKKERLDSIYYPAYLSLVNDRLLEPTDNEVTVSNSLRGSFSEFSPLFDPGTTVKVKLSAFEEDVYNYWKDYNDVVSFSRNPFIPIHKKIRYNVEGGYGYWAGYASSDPVTITIPDEPDPL